MVVIFLIVPTVLIMVTWNTLPDQPLYPIKRGLERVPAFIFGLDPNLLVRYETKLVDRRYLEAVATVQKRQTLGLSELQMSVSKTTAEAKKSSDPELRAKLAANLTQYNQGLEEQKAIIVENSEQNSLVSNSPPSEEPTEQQTSENPSQPIDQEEPDSSPSVSTEDQETIDSINETQDQLEEAIEELKEDSPEESNLRGEKKNEDKNEENKESDENEGRGNSDRGGGRHEEK